MMNCSCRLICFSRNLVREREGPVAEGGKEEYLTMGRGRSKEECSSYKIQNLLTMPVKMYTPMNLKLVPIRIRKISMTMMMSLLYLTMRQSTRVHMMKPGYQTSGWESLRLSTSMPRYRKMMQSAVELSIAMKYFTVVSDFSEMFLKA